MNKKQIKVYQILKDLKIHTSLEIAESIGVSEKTARKIINELKDILITYDINLKSKVGSGYYIDKLFEGDFKKNIVPNGQEERIDYLIDLIFLKSKYIKLDEISENIYVSSKTISNDIKVIKLQIEKYNLKLINKPHYGLYLKGNEIDIRKFLNKHIEEKLDKNILSKKSNSDIDKIFEFTQKFCFDEDLMFSDIAFFYLIISIYVAIERIKIGCNIIDNEKIVYVENDKIAKIKKYLEELKIYVDLNINFSDYEIEYITMNILAINTDVYTEKYQEISDLIDKIYKYIKLTFNVELSPKIYENLYNHILPLIIRLKLGIEIQNPLLEEITQNMPLEFTLAKYIADIIGKKYNRHISDDEIGYLAVIIHLGIHKDDSRKKRVLIVCPVGRATSVFLKSSYEKLFNQYLEKIDICSIKDLDYIDLKNYDCIFSIIDIHKKYSVPIYKVNAFLKNEDIFFVKDKLESKSDCKQILDVFDKNLFVNIKKKMDKEQIIKKLSDLIIEQTKSNFDLYDSIMQREKLGFTEFENKIAIPHPISNDFDFCKIAVAILDEPIIWDTKKIQIVILICINDMKTFSYHEAIIRLIHNKYRVQSLIKTPTYEKFLELCILGDDKSE